MHVRLDDPPLSRAFRKELLQPLDHHDVLTREGLAIRVNEEPSEDRATGAEGNLDGQ